MIELNDKTKQDFLCRELVQKLLDLGVDMSDAKYLIGTGMASGLDFIILKEDRDEYCMLVDYVPTYTVSELLYKLPEYIYPTIGDTKYSGGLRLWKDAPFYIAQYYLKDDEGNFDESTFFCESEYPIESLASLLCQCYTHDIGISRKIDISNK